MYKKGSIEKVKDSASSFWNKLKFEFLSAFITVFLMPFYKDMINAQIIIESKVIQIGYILSYVLIVIVVWILLKILFHYRKRDKNKAEVEKYG